MSRLNVKVPKIAVTQETSEHHQDDKLLTFEEALTDVEELEADQTAKSKVYTKPRLKIKLFNPVATDYEDFDASDVEDDISRESESPDIENIQIGVDSEIHRIGMKNYNTDKLACGLSAMRIENRKPSLLGVAEVKTGLTDVEDLYTSDEEDEPSIPDVNLDSDFYQQTVSEKSKMNAVGSKIETSHLGVQNMENDVTDVEMLSGDTTSIGSTKKYKVKRRRRRGQHSVSASEEEHGSPKANCQTTSGCKKKRSRQHQCSLPTTHYNKSRSSSKLSVSDVDGGVTDQEYLSDFEGISEGYKRPVTPEIRQLDAGVIKHSENVKPVKSKLLATSKDVAPLTDTEEIFLDSEVRKRHKPKSKLLVPVKIVQRGTDVEYIGTSDEDRTRPDPNKTDVEDLEASDDEAVTKKPRKYLSVAPKIKRPKSPVLTDVEDFDFAPDDLTTNYSRAETATPQAVYSELEKMSATKVHEEHIKKIDLSSPREMMYLKGGNTGGLHTDVEDVNVSDRECSYFLKNRRRLSLELADDKIKVVVKQFSSGPAFKLKNCSFSFGIWGIPTNSNYTGCSKSVAMLE